MPLHSTKTIMNIKCVLCDNPAKTVSASRPVCLWHRAEFKTEQAKGLPDAQRPILQRLLAIPLPEPKKAP